MDIKSAIATIVDGRNLTTEEMMLVMRQIMTGEATDAQIGGFLVGMRLKGETIEEVAGAARVMRDLATGVEVSGAHVIDIVGTGGDGANLFNVSTAATFVAAVAGARVAKHGNRSVSSKSGSADLLETAGVKLDLLPNQVELCVRKLGVGFMFAPMHHSAMRYAIGPRKELGMRTLFNVLGPLTNPAGVKRMLIGVFSADLCQPVAEVLGRLGATHALVVHSDEGLDEISLAGPTSVAEFRDGIVKEYRIEPEELGVSPASLDGLGVEGAEESLQLIRQALAGGTDERSKRAADIIALNAGAAIYVADLSATIQTGVKQAQEVLRSGAALSRLEQLAELTQSF